MVQRPLVAVAPQKALGFQAVQVLLDGARGAEADLRADLADGGRVAAPLDVRADNLEDLPLLVGQ